MRIVFLGSPDFAAIPLRKMVDAGYEVAGVFSQPDRPRGKRGKELKPTPVKEAALTMGLPVYTLSLIHISDKRDFDLLFAKAEAMDIRRQLLAGSGQIGIVAASAADAASSVDMPLSDNAASTVAHWEEGELICEFSFREVVRHCLLSLSLISIVGAVIGFVLWFISSGISEGKSISWLPIRCV